MRASGQGLKASQVWDYLGFLKLNTMEGVTRLAGTFNANGDDLFDDDTTAIAAPNANGQWAGVTFEATCIVYGYRVFGHVGNLNTTTRVKLQVTDEYGADVDVAGASNIPARMTADWSDYVEFTTPVIGRGFKAELTTYNADSDLWPCIEIRGRKLD